MQVADARELDPKQLAAGAQDPEQYVQEALGG